MRPASTAAPGLAATSTTRLGFVASTGRTATMFVASTLDSLPGVRACHEGQRPDEGREALLPLINLHNRAAWATPEAAHQVVRERRDPAALGAAAGGAELFVDVAFYNAPLLTSLAAQFPRSPLVAIVRRCEGFVRSATILHGEDLQPAGWPDPAKDLTARERFVALGRLRPHKHSADAERWPGWSAIQRNIWLWHAVNRHLLECIERLPGASLLRFEDLESAPERFWRRCLDALGIATEHNLSSCVARSARPVNARPNYQIGPLQTWSADEQALHRQLATPLEEQIHDR